MKPVVFCAAALQLMISGLHSGLNTAGAGDWPQILGPDRNGVAKGELLNEWDSSGPTQLWRQDAHSGFSGVAVSGRWAILFDRDDNLEIVRAFDVATGQPIWTSPAPCNYQGGISSDNGPRCVPLIHDDAVYVIGVDGMMRRVSLRDGTEVWKRDTKKDFSPPDSYFGVGSSPLIHGKLLIANIGSRDNAAVVAFDLETGETVWKSFADTASYSSPIVASIGGVEHLLVVTRLNLVSLDPAEGTLRFRIPFGMRGPTVNGATPVVMGNEFLLTSSYGIGAVFSRVDGETVKQVWKDEKLLASQYATPVAMDRLVFAMDGRQDSGSGSASVRCIDVDQQKVLWQEDGFDYGTMIRVDKDLILLTCGGELIRFTASADGYEELHRSKVLDRTDSGYRLPALSDGRLFIRDDHALKCLKVGDPPR